MKESVAACVHNINDKKTPETTQIKSKHGGVWQIAISAPSIKCCSAWPRPKQWAEGLSGAWIFGFFGGPTTKAQISWRFWLYYLKVNGPYWLLDWTRYFESLLIFYLCCTFKFHIENRETCRQCDTFLAMVISMSKIFKYMIFTYLCFSQIHTAIFLFK